MQISDHASDILGTAGCSLSQMPHLICNHRKTAAVFSGTGSFDCRIESQKIGLLGNTAYDIDNLVDFLTHAVDI